MPRHDKTPTTNPRRIIPAYFLGRPSAVYVDRYANRRAPRH